MQQKWLSRTTLHTVVKFCWLLSLNLASAFAPETRVLVPTRTMLISSLQPKDTVLCSNSSSATVIGNRKKLYPQHVRIHTSEQHTLTCAPDQKLYNARADEFMPASQLGAGDLLTTINDTLIEIASVEIIHGPITLNRLSLTKPHTFYVSEQAICAHNEVVTMIALPAAAEIAPIVAAYTITAATAVYCLKDTVIESAKRFVCWWKGKKQEHTSQDACPSVAQPTHGAWGHDPEEMAEDIRKVCSNPSLIALTQNNGGGTPTEPPQTPQPLPPGGDDPDPEEPPEQKLQNNDELDPETVNLIRETEQFKDAFNYATTDRKLEHFFENIGHGFEKMLEKRGEQTTLALRKRLSQKF